MLKNCIKNIVIILLVLIIVVMSFLLLRPTGAPSVAAVEKDLNTVEAVVDKFEEQLEDMGIDTEQVDAAIEEIREYNKTAEYTVKLKVQNNEVGIISATFNLPVSEEIYNLLEVDTVVDSEVLKQLNIPNEYLEGWTVTVKSKAIRETTVEGS